jgi:actin-like ATPase involved in cell morphogenesis
MFPDTIVTVGGSWSRGMSYVIGLDVGTTYTAAAVLRDGERPEVVQLGNRAAAIPSVVFVYDGTVLTGDAALRRGLTEPDRLARQFKRRVGDPAPILLGGVPMSAEALFARLLRWTVDVVAEREGGPPEQVAVCHPANWGPYKLELLAQACRIADLDRVVTVTEPEAAATQYAALERVEPGARVAVYDLGGGTFDAAVLRKTDTGFEILGAPEGVERLGGIDFDEAVVAHVQAAIADALESLDLDDPATVVALARLRQECVEAKEALSADVETSIPVVLPGLHTEVRLTRAEFEAMIRMPLQETIAALRRALRQASVEAEDLAAVLLVGGSSRIPMVAEIVGAEVRRPVAVDADPKNVVALGAARTADARTDAAELLPVAFSSLAEPEPAPAPEPVAPMPPAAEPAAPSPEVAALAPEHTVSAAAVKPAMTESSEATTQGPPAAPPPPPAGEPRLVEPRPAQPEPPTPPDRPSRRRRLLIGAAALVLLGAAAGAIVVFTGGGNKQGAAAQQGFVSPCPGAGHPAVCVTSISFDGDALVAQFSTHDLGAASSLFQNGQVGTVFFLAAIDQSQAAATVANGRTNAWLPWSTNAPFGRTNSAGQHGFTTSTLGNATALCALLGDASGEVLTNTGNCAELPPKP